MSEQNELELLSDVSALEEERTRYAEEVDKKYGQQAGWVAFADRRPEPQYDPKSREPKPTHGMILVTNNLTARDRWGKMPHVWLVGTVHNHDERPYEFAGRVLAEKGEITAFAQPCDAELRGLTHWRPAVPEEWEEGAVK
jgi:hypothetical protein